MSEKEKKNMSGKREISQSQETEGKCMHQNISEKSAKEKKKKSQSFSKIQQHKLTGIYTTHRFGERKGESLRRKTAKKEPLEPREFGHF